MSKIPIITGNIKTDLEKLGKIVTIYCLMNNIKIRGFEVDVLVYYLKYGYSDETRSMISEDTGKNITYINTTNTHLRDLGFIEKGVNNLRKSKLSEEMEKLRKQFITDGNNGVFIGFVKNGNT